MKSYIGDAAGRGAGLDPPSWILNPNFSPSERPSLNTLRCETREACEACEACATGSFCFLRDTEHVNSTLSTLKGAVREDASPKYSHAPGFQLCKRIIILISDDKMVKRDVSISSESAARWAAPRRLHSAGCRPSGARGGGGGGVSV